MFRLHDDFGNWKLAIKNKNVTTFFWDNVHFIAYFELDCIYLWCCWTWISNMASIFCIFILLHLFLFSQFFSFFFKFGNLSFEILYLFFHFGNSTRFLFINSFLINCFSRFDIFVCHYTLFLKFFTIDKSENFSIITR